jgi:hypothetical protein
MDDDHRVALPGLAGRLVPNTAPEIDDFLAAVVHAAGAAELVAPNEIVGKRVAYGLEAGTDSSLYGM